MVDHSIKMTLFQDAAAGSPLSGAINQIGLLIVDLGCIQHSTSLRHLDADLTISHGTSMS